MSRASAFLVADLQTLTSESRLLTSADMIHPTALIDRRAELADGVEVGPYAIIEGRVEVGSGTVIKAHSVLKGHTVIGVKCHIGPAAYVGLDPQHRGYEGQETTLVLGDGVIIREGASVHRSYKPGLEHATRLGRRCMLMGTSHVAHDCVLGDDVTLANGVGLAGHCRLGDRVFVAGGAMVHQFVRVGRLAIISGNEVITRDVPPFAAARYGGLKGYNAIGCRRAGIPQASIHAIRAAYFCFHSHRTMNAAVAAIATTVSDTPEVQELIEFLRAKGRGVQPSVRFLRGIGSAEVSAAVADD